MTDEELDLMELLWKRRMPAKVIAEELGYSASHITRVAYEHRDRFPYRRRPADERKMALWIERIRAGRATVAQAAEAMNVHKDTVRKRLRAYERNR